MSDDKKKEETVSIVLEEVDDNEEQESNFEIQSYTTPDQSTQKPKNKPVSINKNRRPTPENLSLQKPQWEDDISTRHAQRAETERAEIKANRMKFGFKSIVVILLLVGLAIGGKLGYKYYLQMTTPVDLYLDISPQDINGYMIIIDDVEAEPVNDTVKVNYNKEFTIEVRKPGFIPYMKTMKLLKSTTLKVELEKNF